MSTSRLDEGGILDEIMSLRTGLSTLRASAQVGGTRILTNGADYTGSFPTSNPSPNSKDNGVLIAWYCFIGFAVFVLASLLVALAYRYYFKRIRGPALQARHDEENAVREASLARMRANISKFTAHEDKQRTRDLCALLKPQSEVIMPGDPRLSQDKDSSESSSSGEETMLDVEQGSNCVTGASPTCSCLICLEEWREGELICRSAGCPHIFHQTCIVSWLVHHRDCPACRQAFLPAAKDADEEDETEEHEA